MQCETSCKDGQQVIMCLQQPCTNTPGLPRGIFLDLYSKAISPGQLILAGPCARSSVKTLLIVIYSHVNKTKIKTCPVSDKTFGRYFVWAFFKFLFHYFNFVLIS